MGTRWSAPRTADGLVGGARVQSYDHHVQANLPAAKMTTHTMRNRNIETAKLACFLNSLRPSLTRVVRRKNTERTKRKIGIAAASKAMILKIIVHSGSAVSPAGEQRWQERDAGRVRGIEVWSPARSWPFVGIAAPPSSVASVALIRAACRFLRFLGSRSRLLGQVCRRFRGRRCPRRGKCIESCGLRWIGPRCGILSISGRAHNGRALGGRRRRDDSGGCRAGARGSGRNRARARE